MKKEIDYSEAILNSWKTNSRTMIYLMEQTPDELWKEKIPGATRKTVGMSAVHIHNIRCMWLNMISKEKATALPKKIDPKTATRKDVIKALNLSGKAVQKLLAASIDNGGRLPSTPAWINFPNDTVHFLTYLISHESHHRGQIMLAARQLNYRYPPETAAGVWQWKKRLKEA